VLQLTATVSTAPIVVDASAAVVQAAITAAAAPGFTVTSVTRAEHTTAAGATEANGAIGYGYASSSASASLPYQGAGVGHTWWITLAPVVAWQPVAAPQCSVSRADDAAAAAAAMPSSISRIAQFEVVTATATTAADTMFHVATVQQSVSVQRNAAELAVQSAGTELVVSVPSVHDFVSYTAACFGARQANGGALLGLWQFDQGDVDTSAVRNRGSMGLLGDAHVSATGVQLNAAAASFAASQQNDYSVRFEGADAAQQIRVPFRAGFNSAAAFAVELWVQLDSTAAAGQAQLIVANANVAAAAANGWLLWLNPCGELDFWLAATSGAAAATAPATSMDAAGAASCAAYRTATADAAVFQWSAVTSDAAVATDVWTHVALSYEAATQRQALYVNGALQGSGSATVVSAAFVANTAAPLVFGGGIAATANVAPFRGSLDEIALWSAPQPAHFIALCAAFDGLYTGTLTVHASVATADDVAMPIQASCEDTVNGCRIELSSVAMPRITSAPSDGWTGRVITLAGT
jgi:hypothetical protein